ncbi:polysaccharide deacetylase family protein [Alicyclobacillus cycloheptanicus]|uniref:Sporulation protein (Polysaccharide deacetylase family) n=1 Tax=Alicyclobacillus cycloheptanicus TaxID=1457 RepID=A0ABT9XGQ4_9BACL|nr:polysaccharide deacetylase family protein [Alicyclobacillus cycloheptanicus]MDQ0189275.1 putative sporulation protein (polysaccharide deacetylase family) [Alicyclobacillus cycloheptanicus]WDM01359.1 polysaccharide deacetylase family protein [Alicyclobacillus cycloheptanicus]
MKETRRVSVWYRAGSLLSGLLACAVCLAATGTNAAAAKAKPAAGTQRLPASHLETRLAAAAAAYERAPVNARVDRVWHAVPGLAGWRLDQPASERATQQAHDGKLHCEWKMVPPEVRLSSLPAEPIYRGPSEERSVALMFNVSWGEAYLPSLLDTLRKEHVQATFFLDGAWVRKHPELAKDIAQSGHVIGSHGTGHPDFRKLGAAELSRQVDGTNQIIEHVVHRRVILLAPPAGSYDQRTVERARQAGMYTILWSDDSVDWMRPSPDRLVERVMANVHPGALVLMHPTDPTARALPQLIHRLRAAGYTFRTVDDVVNERPAIHPPAVLSETS